MVDFESPIRFWDHNGDVTPMPSKSRPINSWWGNYNDVGEFPAQGASNADFFSFEDVIMELSKANIDCAIPSVSQEQVYFRVEFELYYKNTDRYAAHSIVSWPNPNPDYDDKIKYSYSDNHLKRYG